MTPNDENLTPAEIRRAKCREYWRIYCQRHPERVKAQRKAWRENNPEKYQECQKKAYKKYYWAHHEKVKVANRARAREYYAINRDEVLAKQRTYKEQNRDKVLGRIKNYYVRARNARQAAVTVCPAFHFMLELKFRKDAAYKEYGAHRPAFVQRAIKGCPALMAMDASLCPMVANARITPEQMRAVCTMPKVFEIPNAWDNILIRAQIFATQHKK